MALQNHVKSGTTRGTELLRLNDEVTEQLHFHVDRADISSALTVYRKYLNRRNASYMRLEGQGTSLFEQAEVDWNPFEGATGYHRIAVETITALLSSRSQRLILNVRNNGAIAGIPDDDVVELPCLVSHSGARPIAIGAPPENARGLLWSVKQFERLTIQAAREKRQDLATFALMSNPIVGRWEAAQNFVQRLAARGLLFS